MIKINDVRATVWVTCPKCEETNDVDFDTDECAGSSAFIDCDGGCGTTLIVDLEASAQVAVDD